MKEFILNDVIKGADTNDLMSEPLERQHAKVAGTPIRHAAGIQNLQSLFLLLILQALAARPQPGDNMLTVNYTGKPLLRIEHGEAP